MMVLEQASRPATKQHGEADNTKDGHGKERKGRNSGDILARRRFENIRKHSARTRHRTGIINNGEKNRLTIAEKQMVCHTLPVIFLSLIFRTLSTDMRKRA